MDWSQINHFARNEFGTGEPGVEPDPALVELLDAARELAGIPFVINSGLRTKAHNARVGGVPGSAHVTGHVADIRCGSAGERFKIVKALMALGAKRVGIADTFVHCDTDADKPQNIIWLY